MSALKALPEGAGIPRLSRAPFIRDCAQAPISKSRMELQDPNPHRGQNLGAQGCHHQTCNTVEAKPQQLQQGTSETCLHCAGVPFAGQHHPQHVFGLLRICSDAQCGRAERCTAPGRDWGAEMLLGWLGTALCPKMRDCFVPGGLLKGLTDTSLKCDLSCSTLPLLKEVLQQKLQYPGIQHC